MDFQWLSAIQNENMKVLRVFFQQEVENFSFPIRGTAPRESVCFLSNKIVKSERILCFLWNFVTQCTKTLGEAQERHSMELETREHKFLPTALAFRQIEQRSERLMSHRLASPIPIWVGGWIVGSLPPF